MYSARTEYLKLYDFCIAKRTLRSNVIMLWVYCFNSPKLRMNLYAKTHKQNSIESTLLNQQLTAMHIVSQPKIAEFMTFPLKLYASHR